MRYRKGDTVIIRRDVHAGNHYAFRYATGYIYNHMVSGLEPWATPGEAVTIETVLCLGANGTAMYRAQGSNNLMSEMIDHTATANLKRGTLMYSDLDLTATANQTNKNLIKGEYVVITKSDSNCSKNFSNNYIYRVRENHIYLRIEKDNSGEPNGAPYIQIADTRPASEEEIVAYKMNGGPCPAIGTAIDSIGPAIDLRNRHTSITDYTIKDTGVRIRYNEKIHQKAQVFKKRAKTKRKLIIKVK